MISGMFSVFSGDLKYYWMLAVFGTSIFVIQTLLMLFFGLGDHDVDADVSDGTVDFADHHMDTGFGDFKLISLRSIVAFIMFFGWGGVLFGGNSSIGGFLAAVASGSIMMTFTALGIFYLYKLQQSGNIYSDDILEKTGTVYLKIPAGRIESGKVTVSIGGRTREIPVVSDIEIPTGASVKITKQIDGKRFLVEKI